MTNVKPSLDPSNKNSLTGTLEHFFKKKMQKIDSCMPAVIVSYDRDKNRANVKPLIALLATDNTTKSKPQIASVPVFNIGGGGFIISFPLKPGNLGWLIANDRDISLFLNQYSEQKPNTQRIKTFEDGFFLPDPMTGYTIDGEDNDSAVFQKLDGTLKITFSNDSIKIKAPTNVTVEAPQIDLKGNTTVHGNFTVTGNSTIQGSEQINTNITVNGKATVLANIASGANITAAGSITPGVPIPP